METNRLKVDKDSCNYSFIIKFFAILPFHNGGPYHIKNQSIDWFLYDRDLRVMKKLKVRSYHENNTKKTLSIS